MVTKKLASWLTKEFKIVNGEVKPIKKSTYTVNGKTYDIPDDQIWVQTFGTKKDPNFIVRCVPTLKHTFCLELADRHKDIVKLNTAKREVITYPHQNPSNLYGYMTITTEDGIVGDGEVCKETLNPSMYGYPATILLKRAEDRTTLRALGLYQKGWYSQEEFGGSVDLQDGNAFSNVSNNKVDAPKGNQERQEHHVDPDVLRAKLRSNVLESIKETNEKITSVDKDFKLKDFFTNVTNIEPADSKCSNYNLEQLKLVYKGLLNYFESTKK